MNTPKLCISSQTVLAKPANQLLHLLFALLAFLGLAVMPGHAQPTDPWIAPTQPQGHVISLWNSTGTYTNVPVQDYFELWYAADPRFYTLPSTGSNVLWYKAMSCCAAIELGDATVDVSGCTNLHLDVFTPSGNNLTIRLVDKLGHEANANFLVAGGVITNNGWIPLDLPLSQFTGLNLHYIKQIGYIDNNADAIVPADYYIDNVYFYGSTNLVYTPPPPIPTPTNNAPTPTHAQASVLSMYNSSGVYTNVGGINWRASWSGSPESDFVITNPPGSTVMYLPGLSYVGVEFSDPNQIDTTGYTGLHFDVWTLDGNQIAVQLVSLSPTMAAQIYFPLTVTQQWVSINVPLSQFAAANPATVMSHLQQFLWVDNSGSGIQNATFYVDNIYFYNVPAAPVILSPAVNGGTITMSVNSVIGTSYVLETSPTLVPPSWTAVRTNAGTGGILNFTNPVASGNAFFRIKTQ